MSIASRAFRESNLFGTPIRDLKLSIEGTRLAPLLEQFLQELKAKNVQRLAPKFHLSTEWGVPFGTVVIGIPFYLARPELTDLHGEEVGHIEGFNETDILRYLRHEMGHVVNYGYKLYDEEEWVKMFGSITQPYLEDYRPQPFSRRFVRHLPGWYAQKHPDEDWAETFAVWMTPGIDWRKEYAPWPTALAKLEYCERTMARLAEHDPPVTATELDEDVGELAYSLRDYYKNQPAENEPPASAGLDGDLRAIFDEISPPADASPADASRAEPKETRPAAALIRKLERPLMADVFRWTGHFPEKTRSLMRHLAQRAEALQQVYPVEAEMEATIGVTILVTSLAMNHVHRGGYFPEMQPPEKPAEKAEKAVDKPLAESQSDAVETPAEPAGENHKGTKAAKEREKESA
jgi:hypothetical protein